MGENDFLPFRSSQFQLDGHTCQSDDFGSRIAQYMCPHYRFIIRYQKGWEEITGYEYEPWHVRYLGTSTAKLLHDSGLTLEEFLGVA